MLYSFIRAHAVYHMAQKSYHIYFALFLQLIRLSRLLLCPAAAGHHLLALEDPRNFYESRSGVYITQKIMVVRGGGWLLGKK